MSKDLRNVYFVKKSSDDVFYDVTSLFDGVRILKMEGFLAKGKPVNIYTAQWVNQQEEDFLITTIDEKTQKPMVIRENVDIDITFIVRQKYANKGIDVQQVHDAFVAYMTNSDVWIKTAYVNGATAHCVCLKDYKPTTIKLQRGDNSWAMGTITLHALDVANI